MGKFGWHSGYLKAQNIQAGKTDVTTDENGDGTASITFSHIMNNIPAMVGSSNESDITGAVSFSNVAATGATVVVDGSAVTSGTLTVGWMAVDFVA